MLDKVKKSFKKALACVPIIIYSTISNIYAAGTSDPIPVETNDIKSFVGNIVGALSDVAAVVAIGFVAWNGYKIMSSSTNPAKRAEAMSGLLWAILGAIVAIGARWFAGVALGFKPNA